MIERTVRIKDQARTSHKSGLISRLKTLRSYVTLMSAGICKFDY